MSMNRYEAVLAIVGFVLFEGILVAIAIREWKIWKDRT